jgi:hypothetical protein
MTTTKKPFLYTGEGSAIANYQAAKPQKASTWGKFNKNNQQHKTILSHLRTLQWVVKNDQWGEVPDINRFGNWLESEKSPVKKPLLKMDPSEVSKIISALAAMIKKAY